MAFYRVIWPLAELKALGLDITIVEPEAETPLLAEVDRDPERMGFPTVRGVEVPADCTGVLLQRPTNLLLAQLVPILQEKGVRVIVELDDDLAALSPRHPAYAFLNPPKPAPDMPPALHTLSALRDACAHADMLITSTPALLKKYARPEALRSCEGAVVLRNRLRSDFESCLEPPHVGVRAPAPHTEPRVGPMWAGVITTHPDDLAVLGRALPRAGVDRFTIMGPVPEDEWGGDRRARNLCGVPVDFTGSTTFADYLPRLAHEFGVHGVIGLAPLESNEFNAGKSWLKPLEYAACGIPVIRADHPEYNELGIGLAVDDDHRAWTAAVKSVLGSPARQDELREQGYAVARANTYDRHLDEWREAIEPFC